MTVGQLGVLMLLNVAGAATPGPDVFLIIRIATRSRHRALAATAGIATGLIVWVGLTVVGAAAILNAHDGMMGFIQLLGGGWLVWLGQQMLRAGISQIRSPQGGIPDIDTVVGSAGRCYVQGLMTNLSNPKAILFFAALIAPLMPPNPSWSTVLLVIVCMVSSAVLVFILLSAAISTRAIRDKFLAGSGWIDAVAGLFFLVVGIELVFHGMTMLL
ncbi:LysE family transporter [Corynebacterium poyangense]|uniref:LysE family transporter n=2 Tax=Corynebacterium poyangense TaxID=2684405 RepID=A0A7H0SQE1_9CORY|nr:LysE family transporter [Corynebacterium poyangense]